VKDNSALPGGSLKSKPTWENILQCSPTSAFCLDVWQCATSARKEHGDGHKHLVGRRRQGYLW
jgi:hypothetical protein